MEKVRRKKMQVREKVGKSRFTVFFQSFVAPEDRKVTSLKRRVRSKLARGEMKKCTPMWREAHFQVKMYKARQGRTTFGSWDVEKVHGVVAQSTCPSQNLQSTPGSDHFWKLRCRKSARRCGAKHISKSKCTKHARVGPLLEVEMSKKCAALWHEALFQVKSVKQPGSQTTFGSWDVEKVHAVVARSKFSKSKVSNSQGLRPLLQVEMSKKCTPLWREVNFPSQNVQSTPGFGPLFDVQMSEKCTALWREAHFQVKSVKTPGVRTTFWRWDVGKVHGVVARSTFPSQKCQKLRGSGHFLTFRCRPPQQQQEQQLQQQQRQQQQQLLLLLQLLLQRLQPQPQLQLRYNYTTPHYTKRHFTNYNYNHNYKYGTLHYTTQDYTTLHYPTLHCTRPITPLQYDCNYTRLIALHHNYNSTTLQLQQHYTTHSISSCGGGSDHCNHGNHSNNRKSDQLSVHQWHCLAIRESQQPTSPIGFLFLKLPPPHCAVLLVL